MSKEVEELIERLHEDYHKGNLKTRKSIKSYVWHNDKFKEKDKPMIWNRIWK
jgi:hypothetical protein